MWWLVEPIGDDDVMIVAVEGLSAAGKTTWCRRHAVDFVAEYVPTGTEPDGTDLAAQAAYWVAINSQRWDNARRLEQQTGLAVCDSDPLKAALQLVSQQDRRRAARAVRG